MTTVHEFEIQEIRRRTAAAYDREISAASRKRRDEFPTSERGELAAFDKPSDSRVHDGIAQGLWKQYDPRFGTFERDSGEVSACEPRSFENRARRSRLSRSPATTLLTAWDLQDRVDRGGIRHVIAAEGASKFDEVRETNRRITGPTRRLPPNFGLQPTAAGAIMGRG